MMQRLEQASILLSLIEGLHEHGSGAGETHVQKASYFLQELTGVPLGFRFILYKHGPFSFDLRADLIAMQADRLLAARIRGLGFGPSLVPGDASHLLKRFCSSPMKRYAPQVRFVSQKLAAKRVVELERIATALYVTLEGKVRPEQRAARIVELKPHITLPAAGEAVLELDDIRRAAHEEFAAASA